MEKTENRREATAPCGIAACLACALCQAANFEERRAATPAGKPDVKALYGAEAASYYFHFSQAITRA